MESKTIFYNPTLEQLAVVRVKVSFSDEGAASITSAVRTLDAEPATLGRNAAAGVFLLLAVVGVSW